MMRAQVSQPIVLLFAGLACLTIILGGGFALARLDPFIVVFAPFFISGLIATVFLARRPLSAFEMEITACMPYVGLGLLTILLGIVFWRSFYTSYVTSLIMPPPNSDCCLGEPSLPNGIAFLPWLMMLIGSLTGVLAGLRLRSRIPFEVASFSLILTLALPPVFYTDGSLTGWPLTWWGHSLGTCLSCDFRAGTVILLPFFLTWAFWSVLTGGILHVFQLRRKELVNSRSGGLR